MGEFVSAEEGDEVTMNCKGFGNCCSTSKADVLPDKYNDDTKEYDQTVSVNDKVVSKISTGTLQRFPNLCGKPC